jgi:hypothetical protein
MANFRTQFFIRDGKITWGVLFSNNKNDCACCCKAATEGRNVFSISRNEYNTYYNGGTWDLSASFTLSESFTINRARGFTADVINEYSGEKNISGNTDRKKCGYSLDGIGTYDYYNAEFFDPTPLNPSGSFVYTGTAAFSFGFGYNLARKKIGNLDNFYIGISAYTYGASSAEFPYVPLKIIGNFPTDAKAKIDNNNLLMTPTLFKGVARANYNPNTDENYEGDLKTTLTATFTPYT